MIHVFNIVAIGTMMWMPPGSTPRIEPTPPPPTPALPSPALASMTGQGPTVSAVRFTRGGWTWVPILRDAAVESFVGLRDEMPNGSNVTTVWFRREQVGSWDSFAWAEQDQAATLARIKVTLNLPSATDSQWPLMPGVTPAAEPEPLVRGVLASDTLAMVISEVEAPSEFVQTLEIAGWPAVSIDVWDQPCPQEDVLEAWATAIEAGHDATRTFLASSVEQIVANSVANPCGGGVCTEAYFGVGGAVVLTEPSAGAVRFSGVAIDGRGAEWSLSNQRLPEGLVATNALLTNTGSRAATVLIGAMVTVQLAAGQTVAVADTHWECGAPCTRVVRHHQTPKGSIPVYCVDDKCYCCCWSSLQPKPPAWLDSLPNCPCTLKVNKSGGFVNPDRATWEDPEAASPTYHPGASHCIRQKPFEGVNGKPGQQCCYDKAGKLITVGAGAGTPDRVAPGGWWPSQWDPADTIDHYDEDVVSFRMCSSAGMLDCYLRHRPPNNGKKCACNPPNHPHCTKPPSDASCPCDGDSKTQPVVAPVR